MVPHHSIGFCDQGKVWLIDRGSGRIIWILVHQLPTLIVDHNGRSHLLEDDAAHIFPVKNTHIKKELLTL